jgi:hypothetical protein
VRWGRGCWPGGAGALSGGDNPGGGCRKSLAPSRRLLANDIAVRGLLWLGTAANLLLLVFANESRLEADEPEAVVIIQKGVRVTRFRKKSVLEDDRHLLRSRGILEGAARNAHTAIGQRLHHLRTHPAKEQGIIRNRIVRVDRLWIRFGGRQRSAQL